MKIHKLQTKTFKKLASGLTNGLNKVECYITLDLKDSPLTNSSLDGSFVSYE
jgi:hypothetical protein